MADKTEFRAIHRYAPMSARKARSVADLVSGRGVNDALEELRYVPRRAAPMLFKVIRSAMANAAQEGGVEAGQLFVKSAIINDGPLKQNRLRWRPGPMGRAMPIHKRTCHIEVVLGVRPTTSRRRQRKAEEGAEGETETQESKD